MLLKKGDVSHSTLNLDTALPPSDSGYMYRTVIDVAEFVFKYTLNGSDGF